MMNFLGDTKNVSFATSARCAVDNSALPSVCHSERNDSVYFPPQTRRQRAVWEIAVAGRQTGLSEGVFRRDNGQISATYTGTRECLLGFWPASQGVALGNTQAQDSRPCCLPHILWGEKCVCVRESVTVCYSCTYLCLQEGTPSSFPSFPETRPSRPRLGK